jgi:hypothetical protein
LVLQAAWKKKTMMTSTRRHGFRACSTQKYQDDKLSSLS